LKCRLEVFMVYKLLLQNIQKASILVRYFVVPSERVTSKNSYIYKAKF
jgi:hypothetical protein